MATDLKLDPALQARVYAIVARSALSASDVVTDALENGHSLEWQERYLDKVAAGVAAADRGDFASPSDVDHVLNKYRPS